MRHYFTLFAALGALYSFSITPPVETLIRDHVNKTINKQSSIITYSITSEVTSSGDVISYYGIQTYNGYPIYHSEFNISIKNNKVVNFNHHFMVNIKSQIANEEYSLTAAQALYSVVKATAVSPVIPVQVEDGVYEYNEATLSDEPIVIRKMWLRQGSEIFPVYEVSLYEKDHSHWYNSRIDATTGKFINKNDWVSVCNLEGAVNINIKEDNIVLPREPFADVSNRKNASPSYKVFARPIESPIFGSRSVVVDPQDGDASPFGWHDDNGVTGAEYTITRGNNVFAKEDKDANNVGGTSPDGGSDLTFNNAFDIAQSAANFTDASITNLFYWNNLMHDIWWHYGFDESSGNFQKNNYGNGGIANDFVNADAQDGSSTNNANFSSPPDGQSPRMQMFLWNTASAGDYFMINSPSSIAGKSSSNKAGFGPQLTKTPIVGNLVLVDDGTTDGEKGCNTLTNASQVNGNIALIKRRDCNFTVKVKNAQNAGAVAAIIYSDNENPILMGGTDNSITIPAILITKTTGLAIKALLGSQTVSASLYDSSNVDSKTFDSDFDNGIIAHEYGHGISVRLTGGPTNSSCLSNEEQMGEGWSDFFALVMTHEVGDAGTDVRGIGNYVRNSGITGPGIRPFPYSTNMTVSKYTYDGVKTFSVPHGVGSVWCSMLWDLYWAMIDEHGYDSDIYNGTGGNNLAMQLVIDGLKLQPCNPGFTDGRDAIILADKNANNGENELLIWEVFSRRGLGYDANQGSSSSRSDGTEGFSIPPYLTSELVLEKSAESNIDNYENINYTLKANNRTDRTITNIVLKDTLNSYLTLKVSSISCDATVVGNIITWAIDSIQSGDSVSCSFETKANFDSVSMLTLTDSVEDGKGAWTTTDDLGAKGWSIVETRKHSKTSSWFVPNDPQQSDYSLSLVLDLATNRNPFLSFYHWYESEETWDGGVVEVRVGTGSWIDAGAYFVKNGYNTTITVNPQSAISGREAFSGNSGGFIESKIDLSSFAGSSVEVRFRFASDGAASEEGWYIDDISLEDAVSVINYLAATYGSDLQSRVSAITFIGGEVITDNTGIEALLSDDLKIYPNPTGGLLTIESAGSEVFSYTLQTTEGKLLMSGKGNGKEIVDVTSAAKGVYFLTVKHSEARSVFKVMIK